jgi:hypothetical protein
MADEKVIEFDSLKNADLIVDCVYKGGTKAKNMTDEALHYLFPKCGTSGGFRKVNRIDDKKKPAYVILYTSSTELEWPDDFDEETGIFRYYGDNRKPGRMLTDTKLKGNQLLEDVFSWLNNPDLMEDIPPFFIFKKVGTARDVKFLGLAVPGNPDISPDSDLKAFWRSMSGKRFQNYVAYFTVLDTGSEPISRKWIDSLISNHSDSINFAPEVWKKFIKSGRSGIKPLKANKIFNIPVKAEQLPDTNDTEGKECLKKIREYYAPNPYSFEACAAAIIQMSDQQYFVEFELTRPWRDGGRDALGFYVINPGSGSNNSLKFECALEAKCYGENQSVGVKPMSRLISRIKYRQFGILVTTSYVDGQAYKEVVEDGHPILIITARDIAYILRTHNINSNNVIDWLRSIKDDRNIKPANEELTVDNQGEHVSGI